MLAPRRTLPHLACAALALAAAATDASAQCTTHVVPSPASPSEHFGEELAFDGDVLIVSAPDDQHVVGKGSVHVYQRDDLGTADPYDDTWTLVTNFVAPPPLPQAKFGHSLSLSGDVLAVGWFAGGRVDLFQCVGGTWSSIGVIAKPSETTFGGAVALDGDALLVGVRDDATHGTGAGAVWFFHRDDQGTADPFDDTWFELGKKFASDPAPNGRFGESVTLRGDFAFVGAHHGASAPDDVGIAYVFARDRNGTADPFDDAWVELGKLAPPGAVGGVGSRVAVDGDSALVGASPSAGAAAVHVFRRDDGGTPSDPLDDAWLHERELHSNSPFVGSGSARNIAWRDGIAAVAASAGLTGVGLGTGVVTLWRLEGHATSDPSDDAWVELPTLVPNGLTPGALLGSGLDVAGERVAMGAPFQDDAWGMPAKGIAFVARVAGGCWTPLGAGIPGKAGFTPLLRGHGVPELGATVWLDVSYGLGGAPGLLLAGSALLQLPLFGGVLWTSADVAVVPHVLGGTPGESEQGTTLVPITVPPDPALLGVTVYLQAAYVDPFAVEGLSATGGVELRIG